jgi:hypothetical protein
MTFPPAPGSKWDRRADWVAKVCGAVFGVWVVIYLLDRLLVWL